MSKRAVGLAAVALALSFGLEFGSASASTVPFFYLEPTGPTTVPTVIPVGTTTYQLWVDPSGVNAPGCATLGAPINGGCNGVYGIYDISIIGEGSLRTTAFTSNPSAPAFTKPSSLIPNICPAPTCDGFPPGYTPPPSYLISELAIPLTGDTQNGNATPFEVGSMTITNDGSGAGDVSFFNLPFPPPPNTESALYVDANFNGFTIPNQTFAIAAPVPEPSSLLLVATGVAGLAVRRHRARGTSIG